MILYIFHIIQVWSSEFFQKDHLLRCRTSPRPRHDLASLVAFWTGRNTPTDTKWSLAGDGSWGIWIWGFGSDGIWLVVFLEHDWIIFPYIVNSNPHWLIFFRGVETTNQWYSCVISYERCISLILQSFTVSFPKWTMWKYLWIIQTMWKR